MERIKQDLAEAVAPYIDWDKEKIESLIGETQNRKWGLLSLCLLSLGKNSRSQALEMAAQIMKNKPSFIQKVEGVAGFVNFHFTNQYIQKVFDQKFAQENWPSSKKGEGQTWLVDYSSPNIAKYMNVGHLRATVVGQAIVNMARKQGFRVIALNHLGDWGTQFGKLIVAYQKWHKGKSISLDQLVELYVRFHREATQDESLGEQARQMFKKMEQGDEDILKIWSLFIEISMANYKEIWSRLRVKHDLIQGESFYKDQSERVEKLLLEAGCLKKSLGALVVFLEENTPPCMIRKKDGASTYACRDLASIIYRFEYLKVDKNIYSAGVDHTLHFQQLKDVLVKMKKPNWAEKTLHLPFGMYRFKGEGKLSSRKGQTIALDQLIKQAVDRVLAVIEEKNPALQNKQEVSEAVAVGGLIFNDLKVDRVKDVDFSWDKVLSFEGDSGPYVQYCHVRCASLLRKSGSDMELKAVQTESIEELELELMEALLKFDDRFKKSFEKFKPHILAVYLLELCRVFSRFYSKYQILNSPKREYRLYLTKVVKKALKEGLGLLNIQALESM